MHKTEVIAQNSGMCANVPGPMQAQPAGGRDKMLDGFRAVAVAGVIAGHAISYRYLSVIASDDFFLRRIMLAAGPIAEAGVHIFFAISGYIITALMLREEGREGRVSLLAFYVRRSLRILPPFIAFLGTVALLAYSGFIVLDPMEAVNALAFTCNTGLTECSWFVAHSWSLAVEEQYYLVWPLAFSLIAPALRGRFAVAVALLLVGIFIFSPWTFHSNAISFACIAAGAICALMPKWREALERAGGIVTWSLAVLFVVQGSSLVGAKAAEALMPVLAVFLLFGGRKIALLRKLLESRPFQFVGSISYSLYLWQQLFLAAPNHYLAMDAPPVWLLPIVAWLSLVVIERPFIALAHRLSEKILRSGKDTRVASASELT